MIAPLIASLSVALQPVRVDPGVELGEKNFSQMVAWLSPRPEEEEWTKIGWRATLWSAVEEAAISDKPVLLWVMNGHPGGCT
jgi:hypothetical protein